MQHIKFTYNVTNLAVQFFQFLLSGLIVFGVPVNTHADTDPSVQANVTKAAPSSRDVRFATKRKEIESAFPQVTHITIDDYLTNTDKLMLVDVRSNREFKVSRIPGAVHATPKGKGENSLQDLVAANPDKQVLLYCSLGWRSAEAAQLLLDAGLTNVSNLHGSIFEWANRGLPLENDSGEAESVHPYNFLWGWLYLDDKYKR